MSREIQYRAYIKHLKVIAPVKRINFDVQTVEVDLSDSNGDYFEYDFDAVELIQFAGLVDKHRNEIYEGDILLFNNAHQNAKKENWVCVVKYREGSFVCEYPTDKVYNHFGSWNYPVVTWEVIGNIYENPELLEGECN